MRLISVPVYRFDELSDKAKDRAKQDYAALFGYVHEDEAVASLKALAEHFDGKVARWSFDFFATSHSYAEFDMPELEESEIAERLNALGDYDPETLKGLGDCKLTGWCYDEDAIDGFRKAYHEGERDLGALMQAAFKSWIKSCQADCEDFYENDQFSEHCEANEYEFMEDGSIADRKSRKDD